MVPVQTLTVRVGGRDYRLRALRDRLEAPDPVFGELWPAGRALAELMATYPASGKRVLEAGCGLALPSLVLKSRGIDITATDHHSMAGEFLAFNARANGIAAVRFESGSWNAIQLGEYDLIVGADLLYQPDQPAQLALFLERHAAPGAEILIADPGRRPLAAFRKLMAGRACSESRIAPGVRLLTFA